MKINVERTLVSFQYIALVGIVITQVLGLHSISSLLFTGTFFLTVFLWLVRKKTKIDFTSILGLCIIALSLVSVLLNSLLTNTVLSFSYVKKLIMFWSAILFFDAVYQYSPDHKTVDLVFRCNTLLSLILIAVYYVMPGAVFRFNGRITNYLTFGFINPNLTSVFLLCICMLEFLCAYYTRGKVRKGLHLVLAVYMARFIVETRARNCILVLLFFIFVYLVYLVFRRYAVRMTKKKALLFSLVPVLFAAVYLLFVLNPWIQEVFSFFASESKALSSRMSIWTYAVELISAHPLFGAYSQIAYEAEAAHLHNSHLDVAASYGIPVLALVCLFLYRIILESGKKTNRMNTMCLTGFLCVLFTGMGEAMLFTGGLGIYIYSGIFLVLAAYDFEKTP